MKDAIATTNKNSFFIVLFDFELIKKNYRRKGTAISI
jgi:hypothetical protein